MSHKTIVISASSDIGAALCSHWQAAGHDVYGTFRTPSKVTETLEKKGIRLFYCDLNDIHSINSSLKQFASSCKQWDQLLICPGTQDPVGPFLDSDFDDWENSINVNFTSQMRCIHVLMKYRNLKSQNMPLVLLFAGGGTNNSTLNYSAYTLSKIALIKACELLDAEIIDTRFVILGPGWVKTKIHNSTINAGPKLAGANHALTLDKLSGNECNPISRVIDCCDWVYRSKSEVVSGRNFSVVFDSWGKEELNLALLNDENLYKLRRHGNSLEFT